MRRVYDERLWNNHDVDTKRQTWMLVVVEKSLEGDEVGLRVVLLAFVAVAG